MNNINGAKIYSVMPMIARAVAFLSRFPFSSAMRVLVIFVLAEIVAIGDRILINKTKACMLFVTNHSTLFLLRTHSRTGDCVMAVANANCINTYLCYFVSDKNLERRTLGKLVMRVVNSYEVVTVTTRYWRPGEDYHRQILKAIENEVQDEDLVTISEKAISTALGNIVDESAVQSSRFARFLAKYWMRFVWPYVLGPLCNLRKRTIRRLRSYPIEEGSAHKQVALEHSGFLQALMQGSEGAIDGSNLPYSYVALPLKNAQQIAQEIQKQIKSGLGKQVIVVVVDTDKTYSLKGFHFTPRPKPLKGIHSFGGFLAYVAGRFFKLEKRATPIAVAGSRIATGEAIEIARIANRSRGSGAGRTVWDMAKTFRVPLTGVTWEMLDDIKHQPVVIIRPKRE